MNLEHNKKQKKLHKAKAKESKSKKQRKANELNDGWPESGTGDCQALPSKEIVTISPVIVHRRADFAVYKLCGFIKCVGYVFVYKMQNQLVYKMTSTGCDRLR